METCEYVSRLDVENPEEMEKMISFAKQLGFSRIGIVKPDGMDTEKYFGTIKSAGRNAASVLEITKPAQLKNIRQLRHSFELITVKNLGLDANRTALETEGIDCLMCPYTSEYITFNYVMAKLARENGVRIGFSLRDLIVTDKRTRTGIFKNMLEAAKYAKKARCKILLTAEPADWWDMRGPSELLSFGRVLGFQDPQIKEALSAEMLECNRKKLQFLKP